MPVYDIAATSADIQLDERRRGSFRGALVNRSQQTLRTALRLGVRGNAQWSWLRAQPDGDIELAAGATLPFEVSVAVPGTASAGRYACVLRGVDVRSPDERYSDELVLSFELRGTAERAPRTMPPVWAFIIIGAGVLGLIAVVAMLVGRTIWPGVTLLFTAIAMFAIGAWEHARLRIAKRPAAVVISKPMPPAAVVPPATVVPPAMSPATVVSAAPPDVVAAGAAPSPVGGAGATTDGPAAPAAPAAAMPVTPTTPIPGGDA